MNHRLEKLRQELDEARQKNGRETAGPAEKSDESEQAA
jgi:hypothetical protein